MAIHLDLAVVLQLFCLVQGLSTAGYLLLARRAGPGRRWLGLLLLGLTLQVLDYFLSRSGVYFRHRWLYFTPLFFSWGFGPLLWGWVRSRYGPGRPLHWAHFGPVVVQALFYGLLTVQSFDTKTAFWLTVHKPITRYVEHYGAVVSVLVYLALARRLVAQHEQQPRWLWQRLPLLGAFYVLAALDPLFNAAYLPAGGTRFYLTSLVLPVLAYGLALWAWLQLLASPKQPELALPPAAAAPDARAETPVPPAAAPHAPPPPPVDPEHLARLRHALETEELFKDPDLTLDRLARHLGLTPNGVSHLLNAGLHRSFSELVNGYRLAEVQRRLRTPDARRLTVLGLALEAGFNSKSTFNRVFKETTGLTPKDYQKKSQNAQWDDTQTPPD